MAQTKKGASNAPTENNKKTASEIRQWYENNKKYIEDRATRFAKAEDALVDYRDVNKNKTYRTIQNYDKELVKQYLKNISSNEANLRNLSRFLYFRSQLYYRLCKYYANQADLNIRDIVPDYNPSKGKNNKKSMLKSYINTLKFVDNMNLQYEFFKAYTICLREDVFYSAAYIDKDGDMFLLPLDPDYCKIAGVYNRGLV